ncbi:MAG TPA: inositol monophosphatase, partial [Trueperaceae bacterium]|nr:inositol monophosphatase [Trueperaceae bacterium]
MKNLQDYLFVAIEAAKAAAQIQNYYIGRDLEIDTKSSETDLVTKVDKLSEEKIREIIYNKYPDHIVLGEEQGQTGQASHRWIVDPLDGTLNYAHGFPFYCVSIALEINGELQLGVVLDGTRNELFTAIKGQGAFLDGAPIKTSTEDVLKKSMLA